MNIIELRRFDIYGDLILRCESEDNTIKKTLEEALALDEDLSYVDLQVANLYGLVKRRIRLPHANLLRANMYRCDIQYAFIYQCMMAGVNIGESDLFRAQIHRTCLREANLRGTRLVEATLIDVDFGYADLRYADFRGAFMQNVNLVGAQTERAMGL